MNIEIKEANVTDIDRGLLCVFIEGYRYHQKDRPDIFNVTSNEMLKEDLVKNFENLSILIALVDNKIVGYLAYRIKENHTKKLDVDQLVVLEQYRGKGLGKKLMDEVKNIALNNNCDRIELNCWLFNENALAMYEHIGFERQRIIYELNLK